MAVQTVVLCGVGAEVAKSGEDASARRFFGKSDCHVLEDLHTAKISELTYVLRNICVDWR